MNYLISINFIDNVTVKRLTPFGHFDWLIEGDLRHSASGLRLPLFPVQP